MAKLKTKKEKLFEDYLSKSRVFVVDSSAVSRTRLIRNLKELGAKPDMISSISNYDEAVDRMQSEKPRIVLSDYKLRNGSGFDLLRTYREQHAKDSHDHIFLLITSNSSQSLVAQAAEEDVDSFILKPYTIDSLQKTLITTAIDKLYPSPYVKTIEEGKELLFEGKAKEAQEVFAKAKELNPKPSLACFYYGQAEFMLKSMDQAEGSYKEGLKYNKIHYKCLVSLFDLFCDIEKWDDAYDIVKTIAQYFPANPERLASVLRLAIRTKNYGDIEGYYNIFVTLEARTRDLLIYVCAALVICARHLFQSGSTDKALEIIEKVGVSGGSAKFLRIAIENLVEFGHDEEAEKFLSRFDQEDQASDDYIMASFLATQYKLDPTTAISQGMEFTSGGTENYCLHYVLIKRAIEASRRDQAKTFFDEAIVKWPEKNSFYDFQKELL